MRWCIPQVVTYEEAEALIMATPTTTATHPTVDILRQAVENVLGPCCWSRPSYMKVERNGTHDWHVDTGGTLGSDGHMPWCAFGCSLLLRAGPSVGSLEYRDGTNIARPFDLAIHSSDVEHRVSPYTGERIVWLAFLQGDLKEAK